MAARIGSRLAALGLTAGSTGTFFVALDGALERKGAKASGGGVHPPAYPWDFNEFARTLDARSLRRGWYVYQKVCSTCHSLKFFAFRELIGKSHTDVEVKAIAKQFQTVDDTPDNDGNEVIRGCKPFDCVPDPYKNEKAARASNNGALPPDLSLICWARNGGEDYLYSLLTGYCEPPAGVTMDEGMNYNAYFAGAAIGMAQPIYNETVDYKEIGDSTTPYMTQIAKDVVTFLRYSTDITIDMRQLEWLRAAGIIIPCFIITVFWNKRNWGPTKTEKMIRSEDLRKFK